MIDYIILVSAIANLIFAIYIKEETSWIHDCLGWFTAILLAVRIIIQKGF